jgi:NAD(P)-dependent dehydrogenase (short-subunit alcohol dehydrogenase family)
MNAVRPLFEVNVFTALRMLRAAGHAMAERDGGAIVNLTSRLVSIGVPQIAQIRARLDGARHGSWLDRPIGR